MFEVIDNDEFVNVAVAGVSEACFTINKEFGVWGCAPEDNAPTWAFLCEKLGDTDSESVIAKLNAACAAAGIEI